MKFSYENNVLIDEKAVDQDTCQEALEHFVRSFQKVVDLHSQVSIDVLGLCPRIVSEAYHKITQNIYFAKSS